ncbi:MAG: RrF2 family transcriptional regulator [Clostridia bacterium]|jgi:Rrf2 family cysteine metabolism transcriptional repressor|nr:Rrf2 family transcriptional regulator [Clostridiales bacterium]
MFGLILSTKGRYGLRAAFDLALHYGEGPVPLKSISERQNLSVPYLEQLIAILRKDGLVTSVRGAQGGYMLSRHPSKISVGNILRSLEGPLAPAECVLDDNDKECIKADYCVTRVLWEKIMDSINSVIDSVSLQDMLDDYERIEKDYTKEERENFDKTKGLC